jgi:L-alanine-DL-glutamate epimerase-like enolase superfamily enzyme
MNEATDYVGRRGLVMHAIGGIDIALWDIKGQAEQKPISELLGGNTDNGLRPTVRSTQWAEPLKAWSSKSKTP